MKAPFLRLLTVSVFAAAALLWLPGCGASIQAVYEADVRFEHCMALDAQPEVKPAIRRACWVEWVAFYTYGQTRDRVLHAQLRIQQLNGGPAVSEHQPIGSSGREAKPQLGKSQAALVDGKRIVEACEAECEEVHVDCMAACAEDGAKSCRPGCEAGLRACHQQCM